MDPNYYAFATPLLLGLTTLVCVLVWSSDRRHRALLWLGGGQFLLALGLSLQMLFDTAQRQHYSPLTTLLYLGGISCLAQAMASRMRQRIDWKLLTVTNSLAMACMWQVSALPDNLAIRLLVMSGYVAAVHAQVLLQLRGGSRRHRLDRLALSLYALLGLSMLCRVLLIPMQPSEVADDWISHHIAWWFTTASLLVLCTALTACLSASALVDTNARLRSERNYDALTGVLTRRAFEERFGTRPYASGLRTLVFVDVDHFKRINDRYGHPTGDAVLRHIGQVLHHQLRATDVVGRIGGEEFALALRHVDLTQAQRLVARVAEQMSAYCANAPGQGPVVTASFGLVMLRPSDTLDSAMQRADRLLYQAKAAGRNCILSEEAL